MGVNYLWTMSEKSNSDKGDLLTTGEEMIGSESEERGYLANLTGYIACFIEGRGLRTCGSHWITTLSDVSVFGALSRTPSLEFNSMTSPAQDPAGTW